MGVGFGFTFTSTAEDCVAVGVAVGVGVAVTAGVAECDDESAGLGVGAAGVAPPRLTLIARSRHCPCTGVNCSSKKTWIGTDGKNPAIRNVPFE